MNEFIEQFLIEARELVEQATGDLLVLEQQPSDRERLDGAFRAFHTLKGAAGIVDFAAMGRALHAAEDVLAKVRAAANPVTQGLISDCLSCLDLVTKWLEAIGISGELPADADAELDANVVVARFARSATTANIPPEEIAAPSVAWLLDVLRNHPEHLAEAKTAVRYVPDAQCFFRGEDPLARIEALPGLLALDVSPSGVWPPLDAFDPFKCQLILVALTSVTAEDARVALKPVEDQTEIVALAGVAIALSPPARDLIAAQIALLAEGAGEGFAGRLASAGRVAANVLRHAGLSAEAIEIDQLLTSSEVAGDARAMHGALTSVLLGNLATRQQDTRSAAASQEVIATALRVDVARIDALVRLTGELTIVKNAIGHTTSLARDGAELKLLAAKLKEQHILLERLIDELRRSVLNIRVLPLRQVFQRFPRLVRDIGVSLAKPVRLMTEGEETEADKAIVEGLFEPLLHILRNAVDHGVESQQERSARAKPATATIRLRAARQGEYLIVEVMDDGGGVDVARVRRVAAERGAASAEALMAMSDDEVVDLIYAPGFSTADEVTGLSGRGVGMDAARETVERMGGRVKVESRPGRGTTVRFTLPFTVMMSRVMTVKVGAQIFGIPLEAVVETIRVSREKIARVGAARAFVLRDKTIPLCDLADMLEIEQTEEVSADATVVIVSQAGQLNGLEVSRVGERMDVMLKPMEGILFGMAGVAGTTLLGDGRVLIVLDLQELLQ
jgi:two-component system, chemotaxis family, sensor kinase CheA